MYKLRLYAALAAMMTSTSAYAADITGTYTVFGMGFDKCSKMLGMSSEDGFDNKLTLYADGWLTGYNSVVPNTNNIAAGKKTKISDYAKTWCATHPNAVLANALLAYVVDNSN